MASPPPVDFFPKMMDIPYSGCVIKGLCDKFKIALSALCVCRNKGVMILVGQVGMSNLSRLKAELWMIFYRKSQRIGYLGEYLSELGQVSKLW